MAEPPIAARGGRLAGSGASPPAFGVGMRLGRLVGADLTTQVAAGVILLAGWELAGWLYPSVWVSRPDLVVARLGTWIVGDLYLHLATTVCEVVVGLATGVVFGVFAGLLLGRSPVLAAILRPAVVAFYSVPLVALSPLFIMFFGLDMMPKIVLVGLVVFFLLLFNTISGVEQIDQDLLDSFQLLGATRQEEFRKVILPACMVWITGGLKIAVPYALVAATTGEILASRRGIGFLLTDAASMFDMTGLYAGLFVVMAAGLLAASLSSRLERWLLRWRHVAP